LAQGDQLVFEESAAALHGALPDAAMGFERHPCYSSTLLLRWLLLAVLHAVAGEKTAEDLAFCVHGTFNNRTGTCKCDDGWKVAGPTDIINHLKGSCTQFSCTSDTQCEEDLGIKGATCPIKGWDCYCGWSSAFQGTGESYGLGSGYQTWGKHGAACEGPLYTLSFFMTGATYMAVLTFWKVVLLAAFLMMPFGRTHVRCSCYDPGIFKVAGAIMKRCLRIQTRCDGQCTVQTDSWWMLYHDFAWSIYILDVGIWAYAFLVIAWLTFLLAWGLLIWLIVLCLALVVFIGGLCSDSGGGSADGSGGDCDCMPADCVNFSCDGCCGSTGAGASDPFLTFYAGGPFPGNTDCQCDCCHSMGKCCVCYPLAQLFLQFPRRPENMWGGAFGRYCLGTHPLSREVYAGGSSFVDFFGFRSQDDLHGDRDWRQRVADFILRDTGGSQQATAPAQNRMSQETTFRAPSSEDASSPSWQAIMASTFRQPLLQDPSVSTSFPSSQLTYIKGRRIGEVEKAFSQTKDNCRDSSYEDYQKGDCWICCDSKEERQWDLWLQCGHLFCSRCSTQMLQKAMPCPLCRQVSWNIKRGPAYSTAVEEPAGA